MWGEKVSLKECPPSKRLGDFQGNLPRGVLWILSIEGNNFLRPDLLLKGKNYGYLVDSFHLVVY